MQGLNYVRAIKVATPSKEEIKAAVKKAKQVNKTVGTRSVNKF